MGYVRASWDNTVAERFFGILKHGWIFQVAQPIREYIKNYRGLYEMLPP